MKLKDDKIYKGDVFFGAVITKGTYNDEVEEWLGFHWDKKELFKKKMVKALKKKGKKVGTVRFVAMSNITLGNNFWSVLDIFPCFYGSNKAWNNEEAATLAASRKNSVVCHLKWWRN